MRHTFFRRFFVVLLYTFVPLAIHANDKDYILFAEGRSTYSIVVSSQATESEKFAASELQSYIKIISGITLPIVNCGEGRKGKRIIIGLNKDSKKLFCNEKERDSWDESFSYKNIKGDIVVFGGGERGTMYGVFSFLENELGCRWLAEDCTVVPTRKEYHFSNLDHSESPAFSRRCILYNGIRDDLFSAHSRINERIRTSPSRLPKQIGGVYGFLSPHTMIFLMPAEKFYSSHPEYFSMVEGKRVKDQPCFSSTDVFDICLEELLNVMRKYPEISIYEVSALDNGIYCHCPQCQNAINRLGSYSDLMMDFVNRIADAVKDEFPEKKIEYLAYRSARTPPITIIPRDNVVVRLCNIEICHIHGFESCFSDASRLFKSDLKRWREISKELYIWEYASNFSSFYIPTPNFYALKENLLSYYNNGIDGVFVEGNHDSNSSEFQALRIYVLTKLLWNPESDLDVIVNDFMKGYYGAAAPYMKQYFDLMHSYIKEDTHLRPFAGYADNYYSDNMFEEASSIFQKAKEAAENKTILHRIETEELSISLYKSIMMKRDARRDGTYDEVRRIIEKDGMRIGSKKTEEYIRKELRLR